MSWNCWLNLLLENNYETNRTQEIRTRSHRLLHLPLRHQHCRHGGCRGGRQVRGHVAQRGRVADLQIHVLRSRPGDDPAGHPGRPAEPDRSGGVFADVARAHLSQGDRGGRPESVLLPDGEHPRTRLMGAHRPDRGDAQGHGPGARRHPARAASQAAGGQESRHQPQRVDRWRRYRRHPRGAHPGQCGEDGLSRRERTDHRRTHGQV